MTSLQTYAGSEFRPVTPFSAGFAARRVPRIASPFARDVIAGLSRPKKSIPDSCWLFDARGCELFDEINRRDASGSTRIEHAILNQCAVQIADAVGPGATLVELHGHTSRAAPTLLAALDAPSAYVPVVPSVAGLDASLAALRASYPGLPVHPIVGDIGALDTLAPLRRSAAALARAAHSARPWSRRLGYLPACATARFGSDAVRALLDRFGQALGDDSMLVVGVESATGGVRLLPTDADREALNGAFHRNLLVRINRELAGDFDPMSFEYEARFNAEQRRVEGHLVSRTWHSVEVLGRQFGFAAGETIQTMTFHQHSLSSFQAMAVRAGWSPLQFWSDARGVVGLHVLERSQGLRHGACR